MLKKNITTALFVGMQMFAGWSVAQESQLGESNPFLDLSIEELMNIPVVTGTRFDKRKRWDSPVAITGFSTKDLMAVQSSHDMNDVLRDLMPSFNVLSQPVNDGTAFVQPFNLRGLSPDDTLVLINGKRFHRSAVLTNSLSVNGAQGSDISHLPVLGIKRVEILGDGASAQYGSDAIAGVINFILKDNHEGGEILVQRGGTTLGDGNSNRATMNFGTSLLDKGFFNFTADIVERSRTTRSFQTDAAAWYASQGVAVKNPAQIWGSPEFDSKRLLWNGRLEAGSDNNFYLFGNYSETNNNIDFFYRNLGREFFTSNLNASTGAIVPCPTLAGDQFGLLSAQNCLALANANPSLFNFMSRFPGGFTPRFSGHISDFSQVVGLKGNMGNKGSFDVSAAYARNSMAYHIDNTVNPSLGAASPTSFYLGQLVQTERNLNADFTWQFSKQLSLATGLEWRQEAYEIKTGDQASWQLGPFSQMGVGANGFPGYGPEQAGLFKRNNVSVYADSEYNVSDALMVALAGRYENFSDFGSTTNGKLSSRYHLNEQVTLRGTLGTGFRAPSPGQANTTHSYHNVDANGNTVVIGLIAPTNPIAQFFGGKALQPEKSQNLSFGMAYQQDALGLSVDFFQIDVRDRIAQSPEFAITNAVRAQMLAAGVSPAANLGSVVFYSNNFDTRNRGVDVGIKYALRNTEFKLTLSRVTAEVTRIINGSPADSQYDLKDRLPKNRANLRVTHNRGDWTFTGNGNYFGPWSVNNGYGARDYLGSQLILDVEASYSYKKNCTFSAGVGNLLNSYPGKSQSNAFTYSGNPYEDVNPVGTLGTTYYARMNYRF